MKIQFSIRDWLWAIVVVALFLGYYVPHRAVRSASYTTAPQLDGKIINDVFSLPSGDIIMRFKDGTQCRIVDVGLTQREIQIENDYGTCLLWSWKH